MHRRDFIKTIAGSATMWPLATGAQQSSKKIPVVGVLWHAGSPEEEASYLTPLMAGLRELNYRPGENIIIENRFPNEQDEKFPTLAAELVSLNPTILVAVTPRAAVAMHQATRTIPTVFVAVPDPVGLGLVESWSKPGGNMTGLSQMAIDLGGKRLELFKEAIPTLKRVALLKGTDPTHNKVLQETAAAGRAMGIQVDGVEAASPEQMERAFLDFHRQDIQGVITAPDALFFRDRERIAQLAIEQHLPLMFWSRETVISGGLLSYGPSVPDIFRRAASFIDKILKGERVADLPVEQPAKFELILNLKTAKTLGIVLPPALLARADEVIE